LDQKQKQYRHGTVRTIIIIIIIILHYITLHYITLHYITLKVFFFSLGTVIIIIFFYVQHTNIRSH